MEKAVSFLRLTRAEFLLGGIVLFWLGTRAGGDIPVGRYLLGQAVVTSIQLVAQYANEYFDLDADTAHNNRTWFSGGSGVLAAGRLRPVVALRAARVAAMLAVVIAVVALVVDWRLTGIGAIALLGSWWYSAPPLRLVASGFGEVTTALIVGGLVPLTGAVASGDIQLRLLSSFVVPTCLVTFALLLAVHAPDADSDARVGKRTLTVRLGPARSASLHRAVTVVAIGLIALLAPWRPAWSTGLALPGSLLLVTSALLIHPSPPGTRANLLTFTAVASLVVISLGFGLGTLIASA